MGRGNALTKDEKRVIINGRRDGYTVIKIAKLVKRSRNVIYNYLWDPEKYGTKTSGGRPPKVTKRQISLIIRKAKRSGKSAASIKNDLKLDVTTRRVQQILRNDGDLRWRYKNKTPPINREHRKKRLFFARRYMTNGTSWKYVIFSDEKKFNLDGPDGYQKYWLDKKSKSNTYFMHRNMGGKSVMVWGAFSWKGKLNLGFFTKKVNSDKYIDMLDNNLIPFARDVYNNLILFQQDNASIHKSKKTMKWLMEKTFGLLYWPPCSPDLNPMENVWSILSQRIYKNGKQYNTVLELKQAIVREWVKLEMSVLHTLINSMEDRCFDVIRLKGYKTKW